MQADIITSPQAGRILGKSPRTVHRLVQSGDLTPIQQLPGPNGAFLFNRADVEELLNIHLTPREPRRADARAS